MTSPITDLATARSTREQATALIAQLAREGNARDYIVGALNRAKVPTLSGRPGTKWSAWSVEKLAKEAGVPIGYRPTQAPALEG